VTSSKIRTRLTLATAIVVIAILADWWTALPPGIETSYVGSRRCIECHQSEASAWRDSDHDLAMDLASADTVLGDFNEVTIEHYGLQSTLFRDQSRYLVRTAGDDGQPDAFEVKYVFGHDPLQQYLVETKRCDNAEGNELGQLQVLPFCWDKQKQEWFYLSPPDVDERLAPDDPLHWTSYGNNWNHMCARCHSTNLQKKYDVDDRCFKTTFAEIDVSCESCHGRGSLHVDLAKARSLFWDRRYGRGIVKFSGLEPLKEIHTCAPCHSRSRQVYPDFAPGTNYHDHFVNSLLTEETYYPDGQIRDEVYVLGSYMQSKMYAKGVRCSDCHDPHTAELKHEGNKLCTSCHQHPTAKYDTPAHHQHRVGSTGARCVECHMPERAYMEVDWRRDHSMKIPRPDLSLELSTPNGCVRCHLDDQLEVTVRSKFARYQDWLDAAERGDETAVGELDKLNEWAAESARKWWGDPPDGWQAGVARALAAGWSGEASARDALAKQAGTRRLPGIIRASALATLAELNAQAAIAPAERALRDRDPQVRRVAANLWSRLNRSQRTQHLPEMLADPIRSVRFEAALGLADIRDVGLDQASRDLRKTAIDEYRRGQLAEADQVGSHMALGLLAERSGEFGEARKAYEDAIRVQPKVAGPRSNLAVLVERFGDTKRAEELRRAELPLLARDVGLVPGSAALQYKYGLALHLAGRTEQAEQVLLEAHRLDERFLDCTYFLAVYYMQSERKAEARELAEDLIRRAPDEPRYRQLVKLLGER